MTHPRFAFTPDPDLGADGSSGSCAGGISEGSRLRYIACQQNPDLFWEVFSDGSIVHAASTDFTQTAGRHLEQSVSGNHMAIIRGDGKVQYLGEYDLASDKSIFLRVGESALEIAEEGVFLHLPMQPRRSL